MTTNRTYNLINSVIDEVAGQPRLAPGPRAAVRTDRAGVADTVAVGRAGMIDRQASPVPRDGFADGPAPACVNVVASGWARVTISISGWLDRPGVARLRTTLARARAVGAPRLVLDAAGLSGWDPTLPRVLAWARIQLRGGDQELVITGAPARLRTEITQAHHTLGAPLFRGAHPGEPAYRPETADQP